MKRICSIYLLLILLLTSCQGSDTLLSETSKKELNHDVKVFIEGIEKSNGIYLFSGAGERQYLILNNMNVIQGEKATYIKSLRPEQRDKTLIIKLEELMSDNYQDKRIGKLRIFELNNDIEFENIQIFKNDKETKIDLVGG